MQNQDPSFKKPSKKHQPKGLNILFEDRDILVVDKINGLLTIGTEKEREKTAHFLLNEYVKRGNERSRNRVFIVHRLDRDTSGILVFAKSENAKDFLQNNWQDFDKKYYAVIYGNLPQKEGEISSYLYENKAFRVTSVNDTNLGKYAKTGYKVLKESEKYSLLEVKLFTGRKHQIRVHFAENGHPILGDKIYGKVDKEIKRFVLHSGYLSIIHPYTKKEMVFETGIPTYFKALVK
jgi:RluA family pseudouridine synthase